ncbi:MAG: site-specific integrase [Bacteroidales bacterium]
MKRSVETGIKQTVHPEIWDSTRGKTTGRTPEGKAINLYLESIRNKVFEAKELRPVHFRSDAESQLWIHKKRGKTNVESTIPLQDIPEKILMKYFDRPETELRGQMLPVVSNQKYNEHLKEIARLCSINKHLTTHAARHTFATTVTLQKGISMEVVSKMPGHTSTSMTHHYKNGLQVSLNKTGVPISDSFPTGNSANSPCRAHIHRIYGV